MDSRSIVIIGAGPAGLTAALELVKRNQQVVVLEKSGWMGGIARTEEHQGYRFDIGGHRFFTQAPEVEAFWKELLDADFVRVPRLSRIYYRGKFFRYPLEIRDTLVNLGMTESLLMFLSYVRWRIAPYPQENSFEEWVTNRFGHRLYSRFFKTYTEKVWGIPCNVIRADWAAQRIQGLSLKKVIFNAMTGNNPARSLIKQFDYPRLGPGMMWDKCREAIEAHGGRILSFAEVVALKREGERIVSVTVCQEGVFSEIEGDHFISTMPLDELIACMTPAPSDSVLLAAQGLKYRDFLLVGLWLEAENPFPDNWLYIHSPDVRVGRIQNFRNWSAEMVPHEKSVSLGMEYFCNRGDDLWEMPDSELIALASAELAKLGLVQEGRGLGGVVIRQPKAYPVYDENYRAHLDAVRDDLAGIANFQTIGRNGMHRYNNQDHSMLTAMLAARNVMGERHNLWDVNTERSYIEDFPTGSRAKK